MFPNLFFIYQMRLKNKSWSRSIPSGLALIALAGSLMACQPPAMTGTSKVGTEPVRPLPVQPNPSPTIRPARTPTPDRLAEPFLPAYPTQLEEGRHLFWLNCMACHGDKGQGLTAEFRSLYVEDANCWARGCHGGRVGDGGFPIPQSVPAIISSSGDLPPFGTTEALFEFLRSTHPPQHPGILTDGQYWALTAYLLNENGRLPAGEVLGK
jgi:mono/diheme cytochrome c family protein